LTQPASNAKVSTFTFAVVAFGAGRAIFVQGQHEPGGDVRQQLKAVCAQSRPYDLGASGSLMVDSKDGFRRQPGPDPLILAHLGAADRPLSSLPQWSFIDLL
jgi:hypothetical protein